MTSLCNSDFREPAEGVILEGNARYEGFSVDLIDAIAKDLKFKYEIYLVKDNNYGNLDKKTNEWNGLVKELLDRVSSQDNTHQ